MTVLCNWELRVPAVQCSGLASAGPFIRVYHLPCTQSTLLLILYSNHFSLLVSGLIVVWKKQFGNDCCSLIYQ